MPAAPKTGGLMEASVQDWLNEQFGKIPGGSNITSVNSIGIYSQGTLRV